MKPYLTVSGTCGYWSLPTRERELKHRKNSWKVPFDESLPTRERELKQVLLEMVGPVKLSLPTRERELKRQGLDPPRQDHHVAPYTGA